MSREKVHFRGKQCAAQAYSNRHAAAAGNRTRGMQLHARRDAATRSSQGEHRHRWRRASRAANAHDGARHADSPSVFATNEFAAAPPPDMSCPSRRPDRVSRDSSPRRAKTTPTTEHPLGRASIGRHNVVSNGEHSSREPVQMVLAAPGQTAARAAPAASPSSCRRSWSTERRLTAAQRALSRHETQDRSTGHPNTLFSISARQSPVARFSGGDRRLVGRPAGLRCMFH